MELTLRSKHPHNTVFLHISRSKTETVPMEEEMIAAGWEKAENTIPSVDNTVIDVWGKKGAGVFNGWNDQDKNTNMSTIRRILRKYGHGNVRYIKLALEDLL
jgi:hypothetical protein